MPTAPWLPGEPRPPYPWPGGPVQAAPRHREPRRIVQIAGDDEGLMALCNDGTVWEYSPAAGDVWLPLPGIPQRQLPEGDL